MLPFAPMLPATVLPATVLPSRKKPPSFENLRLSDETLQLIQKLIRDRPNLDNGRVSKSIATSLLRALLLWIAVTFRMVDTCLQAMATEHNIDIRTLRRFVKRTEKEGDYFFLSLPGERVRPKRRKRKSGGGTTPPQKKSVPPMGFPNSNIPLGFPPAFALPGFPHSVTPLGFPHSVTPLGFPSAFALPGFPSAFALPGFPSAFALPGFPHSVTPLGFPHSVTPLGFQPAVAPPGFPSDVRTAAEGLLGLGSAE